MGLFGLDRPEGSIDGARLWAKISLALVILLFGLTLLVLVIEVVQAVRGTPAELQAGMSQRLWTYTLIACVLAVVFSERYQRRKLEERVAALEAKR